MSKYLDFSRYDIPDHTQQGFVDYLIYGLPPGGFMYCILNNDLVGAAAKADHWNNKCLHDIAKWMVNFAPSCSWGSKQAIDDWLRDKDGVRTQFSDAIQKKVMWEALQSD